MVDQDQNRNEAATPFKLEEARKRGSVPKSLDANSFFILVAATAVLAFAGGDVASRQIAIFKAVFSNAHQVSFDLVVLSTYLFELLSAIFSTLTPLFLALIFVSLFVSVAQTGLVFSFFPLKPDLNKVNPIAGFRRMFSLRLLVETMKTVLKFVLLGVVLYFAVLASLPDLLASLRVGPFGLGHLLIGEASAVLTKLCVAMAVLAAFDIGYSRWSFARQLRMSRREIRDEVKHREGDPRVKSRLRELQREAVKRARSLGRVKDADVLITNPVRLAVAIKYDRSQFGAPQVIAKGAGFLAASMRLSARRHQIPIVENRSLARSLFYRVALEQSVPAEYYGVVARILFWVYSMRTRDAGGGSV